MENNESERKYTEAEVNKKIARDNRAWLIFTGALSLIGVSVGIYCHSQMKKTLRLVSKAADKVSELTVVDVQSNIVDRAIQEAAKCEANRVVCRAVKQVEGDIAGKTQKLVQSAVNDSYSKIKKVVSDTIAKEAAKIDKSDIMAEATEKAKELLLERFDGKLDGLVEDYQRNLDNVGKIYQSIASAMTEKSGKDVTFKLG